MDCTKKKITLEYQDRTNCCVSLYSYVQDKKILTKLCENLPEKNCSYCGEHHKQFLKDCGDYHLFDRFIVPLFNKLHGCVFSNKEVIDEINNFLSVVISKEKSLRSTFVYKYNIDKDPGHNDWMAFLTSLEKKIKLCSTNKDSLKKLFESKSAGRYRVCIFLVNDFLSNNFGQGLITEKLKAKRNFEDAHKIIRDSSDDDWVDFLLSIREKISHDNFIYLFEIMSIYEPEISELDIKYNSICKKIIKYMPSSMISFDSLTNTMVLINSSNIKAVTEFLNHQVREKYAIEFVDIVNKNLSPSDSIGLEIF